MIGLIYAPEALQIILKNRKLIMWYSRAPKKDKYFLQYKKTMLESKVLEVLREK